MKYLFSITLIFLLLSCNNDKVILLPEISHSEITKVLDVSPAYIFYDETQKDSVELNRKNLISTTNWLVNVDKRLTLGQAIPHIVYLQEKKRNAEIHKNEEARNYFTCNDTSIKNLGFIDFTDIVYHLEESQKKHLNTKNSEQEILVKIYSMDSVKLSFSLVDTATENNSSFKNLLKNIEGDMIPNGKINITLTFNKNLTFQDYITYKSELRKLDIDKVQININEFIFN